VAAPYFSVLEGATLGPYAVLYMDRPLFGGGFLRISSKNFGSFTQHGGNFVPITVTSKYFYVYFIWFDTQYSISFQYISFSLEYF